MVEKKSEDERVSGKRSVVRERRNESGREERQLVESNVCVGGEKRGEYETRSQERDAGRRRRRRPCCRIPREERTIRESTVRLLRLLLAAAA